MKNYLALCLLNLALISGAQAAGVSAPIPVDPPLRPVPFGVYVASEGEQMTLWVRSDGATLYYGDDTGRFPELIMNFQDEFTAWGTSTVNCDPTLKVCPEIAVMRIEISGVYHPGLLPPSPVAGSSSAIIVYPDPSIDLRIGNDWVVHHLNLIRLDPPPAL
jgi:hypothetical protein